MRPDRTPPFLELHGLSLSFGRRAILRDLSMRLEQGERIAITGESGSGKSTLLHCIMGFLRPSEGDVLIEGAAMSPGNVWALRTRMAFVPQEPDLGEGTVREALERPFAYQVNRDRRPEPGRIRVLLNDFRLDAGMLDQALSELSGGEKQRVALITALLLDRALYLLDEVTSALDDLTRDAVCRYFSDHREFALIAVTHDRGFMSCCGRRLKLERGRLWEDGRG